MSEEKTFFLTICVEIEAKDDEEAEERQKDLCVVLKSQHCVRDAYCDSLEESY